jgi:hypothetical protein
MTTRRFYLLAAFLGLLVAKTFAEPEIAEPEELTNLRKLYLRQVERQLEQPKRVYAAELEKLQKKLGAQGKLEDAILVQKERESLTQPTTEIPDSRKPQNAADLQKALENTTWEYIAETPGTHDVRYVILLPQGVILYGWNNSRGTWKATGPNRIELEYITPTSRSTGIMKLSPDLSKWEGSYSADQIARSGKRIVPATSR